MKHENFVLIVMFAMVAAMVSGLLVASVASQQQPELTQTGNVLTFEDADLERPLDELDRLVVNVSSHAKTLREVRNLGYYIAEAIERIEHTDGRNPNAEEIRNLYLEAHTILWRQILPLAKQSVADAQDAARERME